MGRRSNQSAPNNGQFVGIGHTLAPRRHNRPNGSPRKMFPYVTKDQKGTPVESMINSEYGELEHQYNSRDNHDVKGEMKVGEASGGLRDKWSGIQDKGTKGKALSDYMTSSGKGRSAAKQFLINNHIVHFGADPKKS